MGDNRDLAPILEMELFSRIREKLERLARLLRGYRRD